MTWADILSSGSGDLAWRLAIDGYPYEAVSHRDMETTASDGRVRIRGLKSDSFVFRERVDLPIAKWHADGFEVHIVDTPGDHKWTATFAKIPDVVTYLTASIDNNDTTITVASTDGFPAENGVFYLDSETIRYVSKDATSFIGCSRAQFSSLVQHHYVSVGATARYPEVTNHPRSIVERRARLYVYGPGDSRTGDGTLLWFGVVRTEPSFNGTTWSFTLDSLSSILDVDIGGDLETPKRIRGIYYSAYAPLLIGIGEAEDEHAHHIRTASTMLAIAGFWETQEEFCADLTDALVDVVTNHPIVGTFTQTSVWAEPDGDSWCVKVLTDSADPRYWDITIISAVDGRAEQHGHLLDPDGNSIGTFGVVSASTVYKRPLIPTADVPDPGTVPRTTFNSYHASDSAARTFGRDNPDNVYNVDSSTYPARRLYLDSAPTSPATRATIAWQEPADAEPESFTEEVASVDATTRSITLGGTVTLAHRFVTASAEVEIRLSLDVATGHLGDFVSGLAGMTSQYLNTGGVPFIRPTSGGVLGDFDITNSELDHLTDPLVANRTWTLTASTSLREIIENECKLAGVYPCYNASGQIIFRRMRLPALSEAGTEIGKTSIMVKNAFLAFETSPWGQFSSVRIETGYDPAEDSYKGDPIIIIDLTSVGITPKKRVIVIEPKSIDPGPINPEDAKRVAHRLLGVFGAPYRTATIGVSKKHFANVLLGEVLSVSWTQIPDEDGARGHGAGVRNAPAIVIGREWELMAGRGSMTLLFPAGQRVAGYAPSAKIAAITGTSGTTGPFRVTLSMDYFAPGQDWRDHFAVGDKIRVYRWGSTTAGIVTGEVDAVTAGFVQFTTDAAWTYSGSAWVLDYDTSANVTRDQGAVYAYLAGSDRRITWSDGSDPANTLA